MSDTLSSRVDEMVAGVMLKGGEVRTAAVCCSVWEVAEMCD